jgi:NAD dependent epimerase/dehydratase family enzyme
VADLVALVSSVLRDNDYRGAVNAVAPEPVRNRDLTRVVAAQLGRPNLLPVPAFALRAVLGELADELLGSRRVIPQRALAGGFEFRHHSIESAIEAELGGDQ